VVHLGSHPCTGLLSYRIHVDGATGEVTAVHLLADTLVGTHLGRGFQPRASAAGCKLCSP
jgi:hypothetical protein